MVGRRAHGRPKGLALAPWNWTPILMYHEVLPDGSDLPPYAVTRSRLREVLRDFTERGADKKLSSLRWGCHRLML